MNQNYIGHRVLGGGLSLLLIGGLIADPLVSPGTMGKFSGTSFHTTSFIEQEALMLPVQFIHRGNGPGRQMLRPVVHHRFQSAPLLGIFVTVIFPAVHLFADASTLFQIQLTNHRNAGTSAALIEKKKNSKESAGDLVAKKFSKAHSLNDVMALLKEFTMKDVDGNATALLLTQFLNGKELKIKDEWRDPAIETLMKTLYELPVFSIDQYPRLVDVILQRIFYVVKHPKAKDPNNIVPLGIRLLGRERSQEALGQAGGLRDILDYLSTLSLNLRFDSYRSEIDKAIHRIQGPVYDPVKAENALGILLQEDIEDSQWEQAAGYLADSIVNGQDNPEELASLQTVIARIYMPRLWERFYYGDTAAAVMLGELVPDDDNRRKLIVKIFELRSGFSGRKDPNRLEYTLRQLVSKTQNNPHLWNSVIHDLLEEPELIQVKSLWYVVEAVGKFLPENKPYHGLILVVRAMDHRKYVVRALDRIEYSNNPADPAVQILAAMKGNPGWLPTEEDIQNTQDELAILEHGHLDFDNGELSAKIAWLRKVKAILERLRRTATPYSWNSHSAVSMPAFRYIPFDSDNRRSVGTVVLKTST